MSKKKCIQTKQYINKALRSGESITSIAMICNVQESVIVGWQKGRSLANLDQIQPLINHCGSDAKYLFIKYACIVENSFCYLEDKRNWFTGQISTQGSLFVEDFDREILSVKHNVKNKDSYSLVISFPLSTGNLDYNRNYFDWDYHDSVTFTLSVAKDESLSFRITNHQGATILFSGLEAKLVFELLKKVELPYVTLAMCEAMSREGYDLSFIPSLNNSLKITKK